MDAFEIRKAGVDRDLLRQELWLRGEVLRRPPGMTPESAVTPFDGLRRVFCHARRGARGFYAKQGYRVAGEPFLEVGIEHWLMESPDALTQRFPVTDGDFLG